MSYHTTSGADLLFQMVLGVPQVCEVFHVEDMLRGRNGSNGSQLLLRRVADESQTDLPKRKHAISQGLGRSNRKTQQTCVGISLKAQFGVGRTGSILYASAHNAHVIGVSSATNKTQGTGWLELEQLGFSCPSPGGSQSWDQGAKSY